VVQTKRHQEASAQARLEAAGLTTYLPRTLRWPKPAVGSLIGPLFPSYLFVSLQLVLHYQKVCWTPGVKDFIRLGGTLPSEVPDGVIAFLRSREGRDGLVHCSDGPELQRRVRIVRGPLKDLCGIVDRKLSGRDRVVLLMELLRRQVRVEVPQELLCELT
jgi:transcription antitermination factor NusG